ncbi:hypothetical protein MXD81_23390, partial [Microbacteriaceae bacterium K1510]|nr:hypothetical protein [Microbacteriaceae bacterium K1510]
LRALLSNPRKGWRVEAVKLVRDVDGPRYVYARSFLSRLFELPIDILPDEPIDVAAGDLLYVADYHSGGVIEAANAGIYRALRQDGVSIHFLVYDLLPIRRPEWFPEGTADWHQSWLACAVEASDTLVCISEA